MKFKFSCPIWSLPILSLKYLSNAQPIVQSCRTCWVFFFFDTIYNFLLPFFIHILSSLLGMSYFSSLPIEIIFIFQEQAPTLMTFKKPPVPFWTHVNCFCFSIFALNKHCLSQSHSLKSAAETCLIHFYLSHSISNREYFYLLLLMS